MPGPDYIPDNPPLRILIKLRREKYNRTQNMYCSFMKEIVYFNSVGFFHATHDGRGKIRQEADARMRLNLLPCINEVIATTSQFGSPARVRPKGDPKNKTGKEIVEYELIHTFNARKKVSVILRRVGNGRLQYYSVRYASPKPKQTP